MKATTEERIAITLQRLSVEKLDSQDRGELQQSEKVDKKCRGRKGVEDLCLSGNGREAEERRKK